MTVWTIGHGTRPADALLEMLVGAGVQSLVDVRRLPRSRWNPQYNLTAIEETVHAAGLRYRHAQALGGLLSGEPGEERFSCIKTAAFRSYAARMGSAEWQQELASVLQEPEPCLMCAETAWERCHRRLISDLLVARGHEVLHLGPGEMETHRLSGDAEARDGRLYLCGEPVA
jgi:uncharacterized protein (DUF488 family)